MTMFHLSGRVSRLLRWLRAATGRAATKGKSRQLATVVVFPVPPEISAMILSYLPLEAIIALALTCRFLSQYMPSPRYMTEDVKVNLLALLEKDAPNYLFRHGCHLNTWHGLRRVVRRNIAQYSRCCMCRMEKWYFSAPSPPHHCYNITYPLVRAVTNRHFYGEPHGLPLEALNRTVTEPYDYYPWHNGVIARQFWGARIIDDELYLEATVQLYHNEGREDLLRRSLSKGLFGSWRFVCYHLGSSTSHEMWLLRHLHQPAGCTDSFVPRTGNIESCVHCFTDFRVDLQWHPLNSRVAQKGWVVSITRWHELGGCRSPWEGKWYNYAQRFARDIPTPRIYTCEAGMVYRKWRERDDEANVPGVAEDVAGQVKNAFFTGPEASIL
ncbi:hypothetical protein B0I37DRAFT_377995 [Chaetomium sp. MPI-CAGE-AT-0009]|nr:hypothetical protein B0I37DRAFT_377995 [Chaetomium sp. MPI-CAGE-AT-0009]